MAFISNASGFTLGEGTFNNIHGDFVIYDYQGVKRRRREDIEEPVPKRRRKEDRDGLKIIRNKHLKLTLEIGRGQGYLLHSGKIKGQAVIVKVFAGRNAREDWEATMTLSRRLLHPNLLRVEGASAPTSIHHFIAYEDAHRKTAEGPLAFALRDDLEASIVLGFKMISGLSSGIDYLSTQGTTLPLRPESFDVFLDINDRFLLSINPPADANPAHQEEEDTRSIWTLFNGLCQKVLRSANRVLHDEDIERTPTAFESSPRPPALWQSSPVLSSNQAIAQHDGPLSSDPQEAPIVPPRREYVWRKMDMPQSLANIAAQITRDLDLRRASINRLVWSDIGTVHRCPGYVREEVTLATRTADSAVVSHDAPTIQEVCSVCREVVNLGDVFRCVCGHEEPGSHPTLKCRSCKLWSHRDCGPIPNESICSFCFSSASGVPLRSEHLPVHKQDVNFLAGSADEVGSAAKTFFSSPVSAKRARPLQREAKEKEFAEGQHANVIDGVWHCSNCGSPESIAVRRRKGPLGDEAQCGTCGLWEIRQFRLMEYNLDYDFHWQAGGPQKEVEDVLPDEYNAPSPSTPNTMTFPITAAYFERVFYWDGCGNTQYGTVQQVVVQANGTVMLQILLDIGGTVILPRTCTRTTMSVNLSKGSLNPTVLVTAPAGSLGFEPRLSLPTSLPLPHISLSTLAQASSHQSLSHRRARRRGAPRRF